MKLDKVFKNNESWIKNKLSTDNNYFEELGKGQNPELLYIGCSDSRVTAEDLMGLGPGEVFVHRNIANMVISIDLNVMSVVNYAVDHLKVNHVVVCGHYACGGVKAAMDNKEHGLIDNWLRHIKDVARFNSDALENMEFNQKFDSLCELNVIEQVANVCNTNTVQRAWTDGEELTVHGWIYNINNGILKNLLENITSNEQLENKHKNV